MKAEKESIPVGTQSTQKTTERKHTAQDSIWAMLRRIDARLNTLEVQMNIVRTMAMRTERKVYREDAKEAKAEVPPSAIPNNGEVDLTSALWG